MSVVGNEDIYQTPDTPFFEKISKAAPSLWATTAWNMDRVERTMVSGGTADRSFRIGQRARRLFHMSTENEMPGIISDFRGKGGVFSLRGGGQTLKPRRLTRAANVDPAWYGEEAKLYSPFNLAHMGNKAFGFGTKKIKVDSATGKLMGKATGGEPLGKGEDMFSQGTIGRVMSMRQISHMSDRKFGLRKGTIKGSIQDINPDYFETFKAGIGGLTGEAERFAYRSGVGSTITSRISGRASGYIAGAEARAAGDAAVAGGRATLMEGSHFARGFETGVSAFEGEGATMLGRIAGSGAITAGMKAVSVIGWMSLAHDVLKGIGTVAASGISTGIQAAQSVKGSIDKPVMGMGFKDNTVAATSRQRGVMAIQNSQLNARSVLGSEASMIHAHFG